MVKRFCDSELAKSKANIKPESNMKVFWNTFKRELGRMKSVNAMKATTKSSFDNFQRELPFREIYVAKAFNDFYIFYDFIT